MVDIRVVVILVEHVIIVLVPGSFLKIPSLAVMPDEHVRQGILVGVIVATDTFHVRVVGSHYTVVSENLEVVQGQRVLDCGGAVTLDGNYIIPGRVGL